MTTPLYDDPAFFDGYAQYDRSRLGLDGAPEWPDIARMLPDLNGKSVLDLGCGYGWFCREARKRGADCVLGIDVSSRMLERADEMTNDPKISYIQDDLDRLVLQSSAFDLVYSSLALHYVRDIKRLFHEVARTLRRDGWFIFSIEHPIYTAPSHATWIDGPDGRQIWPLNDYQNEGERVTNWIVDGVVKQHRTLGTYVNTLVELGLTLRHLNEWSPNADQVQKMPFLSVERERPPFLLAAFQK